MTNKHLREIIEALMIGSGLEPFFHGDYFGKQDFDCFGRYIAAIKEFFKLPSNSYIISIDCYCEHNTPAKSIDFLMGHKLTLLEHWNK